MGFKQKWILLCAMIVVSCGQGRIGESHLNGSETRNGGYGVVIDGIVYSLDLAMRGVHKSPYFSSGNSGDLTPLESSILEASLSPIADENVISQVKEKLGELRHKSLTLSPLLPVSYYIENMRSFTWVKLPDLGCTDVGDDDTPFPNKVQLAYREARFIRFCKDFGSIEAPSQAAVILHEIIYSAHTEISQTRELVGYIFSTEFRDFASPAQTELSQFITTLNGKLTTNRSGQVTQVGIVANGIEDALGIAGSIKLCFGEGKTLLGRAWMMWGIPTTETCATGPLLGSNSKWIEFSSTTVQVNSFEVGKIDSQNLEMSFLCSGPATGLCELSDDPSQGWKITSTISGDDLHSATRSGALRRIRYLHSQGINLNSRDRNGDTALFVALESYQAPALKLLLDLGADQSVRNGSACLPITKAFWQETRDPAKLQILKSMMISMVTAGADIVIDDLLKLAAGNSQPIEKLEALLESPKAPQQASGAFYDAVYSKAYQRADLIYATGYVQMAPSGAVAQAMYSYVDTAILDYLLRYPEVDVNTGSPFALAMSKNLWDWADRIVAIPSLNVNQSTYNYRDTAAIFFPIRAKKYDMLRKIMTLDVNTEVIEDNGNFDDYTPLIQAIKLRDTTAVQILVDGGADLEFFIPAYYVSARKTPLCVAAETNNEAMVRLLIEKGAKLQIDETQVMNPTCCSEYQSPLRALMIEKGGNC